MTNSYLLILSVLFFFSCSNKENNSAESFGENKASGNVQTCLCSDLIEDSNGILMKNNMPYTGYCVHNFENSDRKYIEKQIVNGKINGKITYYDQQGKVIFEEKFENGEHQLDLEIENIRCDCAELKRSKGADKRVKYSYKKQLFKGVCFRTFPGTDIIYIEVTYENGLRHGFTTYYNKLGNLLYTEKYKNGSLEKVIYPKK